MDRGKERTGERSAWTSFGADGLRQPSALRAWWSFSGDPLSSIKHAPILSGGGVTGYPEVVKKGLSQ